MRISKVVSFSLSASLIASLVGVTGCGTGTNDVRTQNVRNQGNKNVNSLQNGNRNFTRSLGNGQSERITSLKYSPALSNRVSQLREVQSAHVVVTDRDAYVAVRLHGQNRQGGQGQGQQGERGTGTIGTSSIGNGLRGRLGSNAGTATDTTNPMYFGAGQYGSKSGNNGFGISDYGNGRNGTAGGLGTRGYGARDRGTTNPGGPYGANYGTRGAGDNSLQPGLMGRSGVAGSLFDAATDDGRVGRGTDDNDGWLNDDRGGNKLRGYGIRGTGTGGSSIGNGMNDGVNYNGIDMATNDQVPQEVKDKITQVVKKTAPHIRNVHISGHEEFITQVEGYADQSRGGGTLQGFVADFENLVNRIFPGRAGTMTGPNGYYNTPGTTDNGFAPGAGFGLGEGRNIEGERTGFGTGIGGRTPAGPGTGAGTGFSGGGTR